MEDIIKKIVDMDRQAQVITHAAQQEKLQAESDIAATVAALREEYLERARRRIQINDETDRTIARQRLERIAAAFEAQSAPLETAFTAGQAEWAQQMAERTIYGVGR